LWPAKNYVLFKHFASSTYGPRNIGRVLRFSDLVRNHSPMLHAQEPDDFRQEQAWFRRYWLVPPVGYPELDDIAKASGGATNWNSLTLLRAHDAQAKDDVYILRHDPHAYVRSVMRSARLYFEPSADFFTRNEESNGPDPARTQYRIIEPLDRATRLVCCNQLGLQPKSSEVIEEEQQTLLRRVQMLCLGALAMYLLLIPCTYFLAFRKTLWSRIDGQRATLMLLSFTIAYSTLVACMFDTGENMRYRFESQAMVYVVVAVFLQQLWRYRKGKSAA
jgi:hypothetical protein